jgi:hypothetical protein
VLTTLDTELDEWTRQRLTSVHRALGIEVQTEDTAPPQPEQSLEERVRTMTPTPEILEPYDGAHAVRDRVRVLVKLPHGQRARLRVNGREVDAALVGTRVEAPQQNVTLLEYVGVPLRVGRNEILFSALDVERTIHVELAGPPAAIRLENESAPADGISEPRVRVRLVDAADRPVAHTRFVTVEAEGGVLGSDANPQADGFQVRLQRGAATLRLPPSVTTGDRRVLVRFADLAATTWVHMLPAPRDWIMAGVGEVSIAKRPEKQPLAPDEARTGADARAGLFAQGRVGGNGQLTLGVDTERQRDILFSQQERERLYPALGDAAPQQELAPSHWPVYARYDAPEGYAQLGDFRTGWADVELARFDRALSGFDAAWLTSRGRTRVHGFIAASRQRAAKDELQGLGTSGPYVLSKRPLYVHSERLFVETRHRIHTERVLSVRPLVRHADYTIDYSNGTLLLKEPLSGADADFNPIFLVVLYETLEERSSEPMWGVRGLTAWRTPTASPSPVAVSSARKGVPTTARSGRSSATSRVPASSSRGRASTVSSLVCGSVVAISSSTATCRRISPVHASATHCRQTTNAHRALGAEPWVIASPARARSGKRRWRASSRRALGARFTGGWGSSWEAKRPSAAP